MDTRTPDATRDQIEPNVISKENREIHFSHVSKQHPPFLHAPFSNFRIPRTEVEIAFKG